MTEPILDPPSSPATADPTGSEPTGSMPGGSGATGPGTAAPRRRKPSRSSTRNLVEWALVIIGAILVAFVVKTFLVQAFRIPSESMEPTLLVGDRVLVNKLSYRLHDVNRGDVVVFTRPTTLAGGDDEPEDLIKRVIGLPGDTVQTKDGDVYVNGRELDEPYLPPGTETNGLEDPLDVPAGHVLVMGDNRGNSQDGRVFGPISEETIVGRAFMIMWPPGRVGSL